MTFGPNIVRGPRTIDASIALEPAHNIMGSLSFLSYTDHYPGLSQWLIETAGRMPENLHVHNRVISEGLLVFIKPLLDQSWPSFPAFVSHIATMKGNAARQMMRQRYEQLAAAAEDTPPLPSWDALLADRARYVAFMLDKMQHEYWDPSPEVHEKAYRLLNAPSDMLAFVSEHLQTMWERYFADEWTQRQAMLVESVRGFQQMDLSDHTLHEAITTVTRRDLRDVMAQGATSIERVTFIPSPHAGPYVAFFTTSDQTHLRLVFGARVPEGMQHPAADLSRAELLVRLNALADDTRLRIIDLLTDHDELCAQDIIDLLAISQSAASRHLRQLSANGYLIERRIEGAKCYQLHTERFEETLDALRRFVHR